MRKSSGNNIYYCVVERTEKQLNCTDVKVRIITARAGCVTSVGKKWKIISILYNMQFYNILITHDYNL